MTQEDRELLLKDLSARLPYGVIINIPHAYSNSLKAYLRAVNPVRNIIYYEVCDLKSPLFDRNIFGIKPYLRRMSSMTEEERNEYFNIIKNSIDFYNCPKSEDICFLIVPIDWLNAHHFDYRGLIDRGLALEASEGIYI